MHTCNNNSESFGDFGISTQVFCSYRAKAQWTFEPACVKAKKRSLAELHRYFGNAVFGKKTPNLHQDTATETKQIEVTSRRKEKENHTVLIMSEERPQENKRYTITWFGRDHFFDKKFVEFVGYRSKMQDKTVYHYRTPLITHFGISMQVFFSGTRHQKRSLTELNEYFGNTAKVQWTFERACVKARTKTMLKTEIELLEVSYKTLGFVTKEYTVHTLPILPNIRTIYGLSTPPPPPPYT